MQNHLLGGFSLVSALRFGKARLERDQFQGKKNRKKRFWAFIGSILGALLVSSVSAGNLSDFIPYNYDFKSDGTTNMPGRLLIPPTYSAGSGQTYPLVIYFHGSGQRWNAAHTNTDSQVTSADINNLAANAKSRNFFLYAPQEPDPQNNWSVDYVRDAMKMVAKIRREYAINPDKIYVTGLSMGCGGTYIALTHYPEIFAAGVPISGGLLTPAIPDNIGDESVWIFHGRADTTNPVGAARTAYNLIRTTRGLGSYSAWPSASDPDFFLNQSDSLPLRYTEYKNGTHSTSTWGVAYNEAGLYDWLFAQSRAALPPQVGETVLFDFGQGRSNNFVADSQGRCWNGTYYWDFMTLETLVPYAMTSQGYRTSAMLRLVTAFGSDNNSGVATGTPYDSIVGQDGWLTKANATASANYGQMEIGGLQPNAPYQIKIYASNTVADGAYNRVSRYEIGEMTADLNVLNNATGQAVFASVTSDGAGSIMLKVYGAPGSPTTRYGQINALELTALEPPPVWAPPLLRWSYNETYGTVATDTQAFQNGTLLGQATWTTGGHTNGGIILDGTNDGVQAPDRPELGGSALSASLWFKPALLDGNPRGLISKRTGIGIAKAFSLYLHTGNKLFVSVGDEASVDTGFVVPAINQWYHVAMVFDGSLATGRLKVYINGALQSQTQPVLSAIPDTTGPLHVGILNANYGYSFQGVIDEAQIYNTALTPENVAQLAQ
jgi:poly(3-hydroxybutyrate) depolymerase